MNFVRMIIQNGWRLAGYCITFPRGLKRDWTYGLNFQRNPRNIRMENVRICGIKCRLEIILWHRLNILRNLTHQMNIEIIQNIRLEGFWKGGLILLTVILQILFTQIMKDNLSARILKKIFGMNLEVIDG